MKDSYSLDRDRDGLDRQFEAHRGAYDRIFSRLGLDSIGVEASSGNMGGSDSVEFVVRSETGEDRVATCGRCGYSANLERAISLVEEVEDTAWVGAPQPFATPGIRTIAGLAEVGDFAAAERQIKTLAYMVGGEFTLVALRGDHDLEVQKLADSVGEAVRAATEEEIVAKLGAHPGSLGPVGVLYPVIADPALAGRTNLVTGANEDDVHIRGVDVARDLPVTKWVDLRTVNDGERCGSCGEGTLSVMNVIEVGHIFKLGTKYSEALGASVLDETGRPTPIVMGSYGIGVGRAMAAVVEVSHDERGIIWPVSAAPFTVVITLLRPDNPAVAEAGDGLYRALVEAGLDVLLDDRKERPGVKFADAELIGIPYRLTVGPRGLEAGEVELAARDGSLRENLPIPQVTERLIGLML